MIAKLRTWACIALFAGLTAMIVAPAHAHESNHYDLSIQPEGLDRTVFSFSLNDYARHDVTIDGGEYLALSLEGAAVYLMDQVGFPQIPMLATSVAIPDRARMAVKVLESEYRDIQNVQLAPYKGTLPRTVDPATVDYTFGAVYGEDAWFPKNAAQLRDPYILRDVRGQVVEILPFQYNPVKKVLRVHTKLRFEVVADGESTINVPDRSVMKHRPDRSFSALYQQQFSNLLGFMGDPPAEDGDLLVICHGAFMANMQPLVDWKNSIGINTSIVDVATIGNNYTSIKNYIKNLYNQSNLTFVLLVGDNAQVKSGTYQYGASDAYYSTITADKYPDLFVGRFSANSTAQVDTQVQRTLEYEQVPHHVSQADWNAMGMGIASNQGAGAGHYGESDDQHEDLIRDELLAYGFTKVDRIYDYSGTKTMVTNGLNEGRRCVNYTGHGWMQGWGSTGFDTSDVDKLKNAGMLPFICSVACNNGEFDSGTCFGEAWMWATDGGEPTGAIACYMSSVSQSWAPPMYGQGNHSKSGKYGGVERFWKEMQWSIGGQWYGGGCCMMDLAGSGGQQEFMNWILFGDPSLRIHGVAGPQTLTCDTSKVPLTTPVTATFTIEAGPDYQGENYFLLAGVTGTQPGTPLPGGLVMPLNFDIFTYMVLAFANTPMFKDFYGVLDAQGMANPVFDTTGLTPLDPRFLGTHIFFCAVTWPKGKPYDFVTNARILTVSN